MSLLSGALGRLRPARASAMAAALAAGALLISPSALADDPFSFNPPGMLVAGSGEGRFDEHVYAPGMRFPLEEGPAYLNSQVWGHGGSQGPGGSQCDPANRSYPWWDNYCETRAWDMPLCPAGQGHQGQDIRAATCDNDAHWVVAAADGEITSIGSYTVYLTTEDGTRFDYLHMSSVQVAVGEQVQRGQRLGKVSNAFGGTPTTIHLHMNIRQNVAGVGIVFVPPYMSLVASYQEIIDDPAEGELASATCERVKGAAFDPDAPDAPSDVRISIGGAWDDPGAFSFDVAADRPTDLLCGEGGAPCGRGFDAFLPVSLLDGQARELHLYAVGDAQGAPLVELVGSPAAVACEVYPTKDKARRPVDAASMEAWGFSLLFDQLPAPPAEVDRLAKGEPLPASPRLVASPDGALHVADGDLLRAITEDAALAFRIDPASAELWSDADLDAAELGEPWPARPVLVRGEDQALHLLDAGARIPIDPGKKDEEPGPKAEQEDTAVSCTCRSTPGAPAPIGALAVAIASGLALWRIRSRRAPRRAVSTHPFRTRGSSLR